MRILIIVLLILISIPSIAFADLPEKNRGKDIPPTLTITRDGGKWADSYPAPYIKNEKPNTKFYPDKKKKEDEDDLSDVEITFK